MSRVLHEGSTKVSLVQGQRPPPPGQGLAGQCACPVSRGASGRADRAAPPPALGRAHSSAPPPRSGARAAPRSVPCVRVPAEPAGRRIPESPGRGLSSGPRPGRRAERGAHGGAACGDGTGARKKMEELLEASLKTRTEAPEPQKQSATALMTVWTSESSQLSSWTLQILKPN
ncbi:uncharacterized protein LOC129556226 [Moschus berezovskii]|uniref:uncharacterized protein LOC129556226 n=1 Tax=Moschus berezovskii TaxID=68408 RepID=UPI0024450ADB|nr:uncharacterized protein LOC129556226 [Moschus berezovskii]